MRALSPRKYHRSPGLIVTGYLSFLQFIIRHDNYILKLARMGFIDPKHINYSIPINENSPTRKNDKYYTDLSMEATRKFLRLVMKPQPWVEAMLNEVLDPIRDYYKFGMHIRMGNSGGTFKDSHIFLHFFDIWRFTREIQLVISFRHMNISQTRWLLSTDSDKAEEMLREKFGEYIVTSTEFKRGHSKTGAKNADGFSRAVIDLLLLGRCDYLVLTSHSTFSVMARELMQNYTEAQFMTSMGYH